MVRAFGAGEGRGLTAQGVLTRGGKVPSDGSPTMVDLLNEAPSSKFHRRTVVISGVGFFTDAYDLFVIGTAAALVTTAMAPQHAPDQLGYWSGRSWRFCGRVRIRAGR